MGKILGLFVLFFCFSVYESALAKQNEDTFMHQMPWQDTGTEMQKSEHQGSQTFMHTAPGQVGTHNDIGSSQSEDTFMHTLGGQNQGTDMQGGGNSQSTDTFLHNPNGLQTGTENTR